MDVYIYINMVVSLALFGQKNPFLTDPFQLGWDHDDLVLHFLIWD